MGDVSPLPRRKPAGCPICGKPAVERFHPFCSKRCADIDLGRWLNESYRVKSDEAPDDSPSDEAQPGNPKRPTEPEA